MVNVREALKELQKPPEGQGLVEYALILFLVAIVVIAILILLGPQIGGVFSKVTDNLDGCKQFNNGNNKCK